MNDFEIEHDPEEDDETKYCTDTSDPRCPFDCRVDDDWPDRWNDPSDAVFERLNDVRAEGTDCGDQPLPAVEPLQRNPALDEAARCHSLDMAAHSDLSHEGSDGSTEVERAAEAGYPSAFVGEILAAGHRSADDVVEAWIDSDGHCENLMFPHYESIGVSYVEIPQGRYWTVKFGAVF